MDYKVERYLGEKVSKELIKNHIFDLFSLLNYFPKRYEVFTLSEFVDNKESQTIKGIIVSDITVRKHHRNLKSISFKFKTGENIISVVSFGRDYLLDKLYPELSLVINGNYDKNVFNIAAIFISDYKDHIKPIYNFSELYDYQVTQAVRKALRTLEFKEETIPDIYLKKYKLPSDYEVFRLIHFPETLYDIHQGKRKLKYQEALIFQLAVNDHIRAKFKRDINPLAYNLDKIRDFIKNLPFDLTEDQKKAVNQLFIDFKSDYPIERLIEGDVGSGKTVVVAIAFFALAEEHQGVLMAPTEILARQHFQTLSKLFENYPIRLEIITGAITGKKREAILKKLKAKEIDILVGTHAIIQPEIVFNDLRYIVIDEEQRFGVEQKKALQEKGEESHLITLSATPIPKSLAATILQDVRIVKIKTKPALRKKIITRVLNDREVSGLIQKMNEELSKGRQIYIVVPLIEESENLEVKNALDIYHKFKDLFTDITEVGLLHGKLSAIEKNQVTNDFAENKIGILVSTTVVEVGVDIKNATMMVVLDADRFGLSTLHQLRGRVGRNDLQCYCYYVSKKEYCERLKVLEEVDDCFLLSEYDLKARGPGQFFGTKQTGFGNFLFLDFVADFKILELAKTDALEILDFHGWSQTENLSKLKFEVQKLITNFIKDDII